jgi:uncharacterized membrane protein
LPARGGADTVYVVTKRTARRGTEKLASAMRQISRERTLRAARRELAELLREQRLDEAKLSRLHVLGDSARGRTGSREVREKLRRRAVRIADLEKRIEYLDEAGRGADR